MVDSADIDERADDVFDVVVEAAEEVKIGVVGGGVEEITSDDDVGDIGIGGKVIVISSRSMLMGGDSDEFVDAVVVVSPSFVGGVVVVVVAVVDVLCVVGVSFIMILDELAPLMTVF